MSTPSATVAITTMLRQGCTISKADTITRVIGSITMIIHKYMFPAQKNFGFISKGENMKKYMFLLVCFLVVFMSACESDKSNEAGGEKEKAAFQDVIETNLKQDPSRNIIAQSKFYSIYREGTSSVYNIYDSMGNVVLTEMTDRPLRITMTDEYVVDIAKGMGTGITLHQYYDAENDIFSEEFCYVAAVSENLIAYIDAPYGFEGRKLVVRNIFDENVFLKEFYLDFSRTDTPIVDASFLEGNTFLHITYLSKKTDIIVEETLKLY